MKKVESVYVLDDLSEVPAIVGRMRSYGRDVGFDIETVDRNPIKDQIVALQFKPKGKKAAIIDVRHFSKSDLRMLGSMLEPLFDGSVTLVGQNLKFDLEFLLAQLGLAAHKVYDTMLAEQIILGLGVSSAKLKNIHFGMADIADRYGVDVHKEERSWFIHLDTRVEGGVRTQVGVQEECVDHYYNEDGQEVDSTDDDDDSLTVKQECQEVPVFEVVGGTRPWDEPFPVEQIIYMRQDVSVVHKIKEAQQTGITEYGLGVVIDIEMRALPALTGIEVFGVQINREGWLSVIDRVEVRARELETVLHLGKPPTYNEKGVLVDAGFEGLDVHVLKVRQEKYLEKWRPYQDWMKARDAFIATRKAEWDALPKGQVLHIPERTEPFKNWSEYKKWSLDWWYERNGRQARPPASKSGVNLGSWMQVRDGLNDLGIPVKGVSEEELEPYRNRHPLVGVYIDYSHARKVVTVYGREKGKKAQSFIELLDEHDRLRASYQQIGADTGRMSSFQPNFQQIPADGVGSELRKNVVAAPSHTLVVADFSNIELRIVAELSGDKFLLDAFGSGEDVHAYTAAVMFGLPAEQATKDWTNSHNAVVGGRELENTSYRKVAKTINYMLLYGAGVKRLAVMLGISDKDAKALLDLYYSTFATAMAFLNEQKGRLQAAKDAGESRAYAETRAGRRRWFDIPKYPKIPKGQLTTEAWDELDEKVAEWKKQTASIKRQLANTPIQGLSADITKLAAALWYEAVGYSERMRLVAVIHDEFIIELLPKYAEKASHILADVMMKAMKTFLYQVDLGEVKPVVSDHWVH
jgi:DNA polymerase I-like protein with 3'-5' exonuclease and polymerase domains